MAPTSDPNTASEKDKANKVMAPSKSNTKTAGLDMTDCFGDGNQSEESDFEPGYHGTMTEHQDRLHNEKVRGTRAQTPAFSAANPSKKPTHNTTAQKKAKSDLASKDSGVPLKHGEQSKPQVEQNGKSSLKRKTSSPSSTRGVKQPRTIDKTKDAPEDTKVEPEQSIKRPTNPRAAKLAAAARPDDAFWAGTIDITNAAAVQEEFETCMELGNFLVEECDGFVGAGPSKYFDTLLRHISWLKELLLLLQEQPESFLGETASASTLALEPSTMQAATVALEPSTIQAVNNVTDALGKLNATSLRGMLGEVARDIKDAQNEVKKAEQKGSKEHIIQKSKVDLTFEELKQAMLKEASKKNPAVPKQKNAAKKGVVKGKKNE